jgi:L-ascorbate metabolism protein UlaG (beta-lactamase superfamily)
MGTVSGFVFIAQGEPTVYWTGDTIWCEPVAQVIKEVKPEVILTHSCGAVWGKQILIVMDAAQTVAVCRAAPQSKVVAIHMEALDHTTVDRAALRKYADAQGIGPEQLLIPADGEKIHL